MSDGAPPLPEPPGPPSAADGPEPPAHFPPPPIPPAYEQAYSPEHYWGYYPGPALPGPEVRFRATPAWGWIAALGVVAVCGIFSAVFGQGANFWVAALQGVPFALLSLLAYVGRKHTWAIAMAVAFLAVILFVATLATIGFSFTALLAKAGALASDRPRFRMPPGGAQQIGGVVVWSLLAWLSALIVAFPGVRRVLARKMPIDPESPVHAIGLATVVPIVVLGMGQLIALEGRPPLLTLVQHSQEALKSTAQDLVAGMVFGFAWMLPCAVVTVGWPLIRAFPEALERLGWVRPTGKQIAIGLGAAVGLVAVVQGADTALNQLWAWTGWPKTDAAAFEQLIKPLITHGGAVLIGVTAGIGEEIAVRGVLQPRFGILLSNLFFVSLHAFQYGFDGLLVVFAVGMALGYLRKRTNTTTSAITHGTYDFILVFYSWYAGN